MRTKEQLERLYAERPSPRAGRGTVNFLVVRVKSMQHETPEQVALTPEDGVLGDRWTKGWGWRRDVNRQVTIMSSTVAELVCDGQPLDCPGDNLLVTLALDLDSLPAGSRLRAGTALLEVSQKPHNGCKKFLDRFGEGALAWVNSPEGRAQRLRGVNCRVIEAGEIRIGDPIEVE